MKGIEKYFKNKCINRCLFLLAIVCLFVLFVIGYDINCFLFHIDDEDSAQRINQLWLNLCSSYITGYFVYLLTLLLPHSLRKKKISSVLYDKFETIKAKIEHSVKSIYLEDDENKPIPSKDTFKNDFVASHITDIEFKQKTGLNLSLFEYLIKERDEIKSIISEMIEYHDFLSSESIVLLENKNHILPLF